MTLPDFRFRSPYNGICKGVETRDTKRNRILRCSNPTSSLIRLCLFCEFALLIFTVFLCPDYHITIITHYSGKIVRILLILLSGCSDHQNHAVRDGRVASVKPVYCRYHFCAPVVEAFLACTFVLLAVLLPLK